MPPTKHMEKPIAIIDCGTNTFHLLTAALSEKQFRILSSEKKAVWLGAGGINDGTILPDAEARALGTLSDFKHKIEGRHIENTYAFATSAFRNATNGRPLQQKIYDKLHLDVKIISGDEEAELIFCGVRYALRLDREIALVMDIGGGSVEFIIGNGEGILWKRSFEIGVQRLVEKFHRHDPITTQEVAAIDRYLDTALQPLFEALKAFGATVLCGASGTFDTLSEIYCAANGITTSHQMTELPFDKDAYFAIHRNLVRFTRSERLQIPGMISMRVDMIVVASCLINHLMIKYGFQKMRVSAYALKEGCLVQLTDRNR